MNIAQGLARTTHSLLLRLFVGLYVQLANGDAMWGKQLSGLFKHCESIVAMVTPVSVREFVY